MVKPLQQLLLVALSESKAKTGVVDGVGGGVYNVYKVFLWNEDNKTK